jgi:hypothetical protein
MPSLRELADNISNFNYYSGTGNFTQNNIKFPDPAPLFGPETTLMLKPKDFKWSPSNFDDGFVPFGVVARTRRAADDTLRIGKFLSRTTTGLLFNLKQQALQASNPKIEYDPTTEVLPDFGPTRIFTPLPLLAQVAGNALGARFMRHGVFPKVSDTKEYETYVLKKDAENQNRLVGLSVSLARNNGSGFYSNNIITYKGGPGSFNGLGSTTIRRYYRSMWAKSSESNRGFIPVPIGNLLTIKADSGKTTAEVVPGAIDTRRPVIDDNFFNNNPTFVPTESNSIVLGSNTDFRYYKNKLKKEAFIEGAGLPETNYEKYNLETRVGIAKPRSAAEKAEGIEGEKRDVGTADKVNLTSLYYSQEFQPSTGLKDFNGREPAVKDSVKFFIKSINNDKLSFGIYIVFRAFIVNVKRSVQAKWNPYNYVGRGESFYLYDGYGETITVSFNIAASSRLEMRPLYQKLNYLISTLAPDYSADGKIRGNISELTIGNFLSEQPGIITNLDMSIDEDSNWEIALESDGRDSDMLELPQIIKCSMTFIPIYNFLPKRGLQVPFIGIDNRSKEKNEDRKWLKSQDTTNYKNNEILSS